MSVQSTIENKLQQAFHIQHLDVANESHMHSVPENSETHFKVVLVSESFIGKRQVARHQLIYAALAQELAGPIHALALHTYAPDEWQGNAPLSPKCMGGSK